eukprot:GFUD01002481.1.p1 GENE.GFUD01002481.1~~GFUD01002481.1.p1  ORF type:complete len:605 (-),score=132.40 GFUD01002481.1:649-2463(-)
MEEPRDELCLKWDNFQSNLTDTFDQLRKTEDFVDVTLTVGGRSIKCHKVVLSASSPYFAQLFSGTPGQHPIVILNDIQFNDLKMVVEYMYRGEISVKQEQLESIMQVAEALGVRGLVDVSGQPSLSQVKTSPEPAVPPALIPTNVNKAEFCGNCSGYTPNKKRRLYEDPASNEKPLNCSRTPGPDHRTARTPTIQTPTGSGIENRMPPSSMGSLRDPYSRTAPTSPDLENYNDIRPDILEMIKEEQKAKLLEPSQNWASHSGTSSSTVPGGSYCYQNQLQSMWQKCWNQNASMFQGVRYRERGPMKSWRSETMAEAIWSVLQEGLSLSQAARKHDIPYPTFVLYANRVHNMLGPSPLNGFGLGDLRPKGRGRPQRILLGQWPEEHVRGVIRAVVFREGFSTGTTPPAPVSSPQTFTSELPVPKTEPPDSSPPQHPLAAESRAAQAAFETQMKSLYNNPFASQLLAASSKMFSNFDVNPFLQTTFKQEVPDDNFADADEQDSNTGKDKLQANPESDQAKNNQPMDLANNTVKSIDAIASKLVTSAELDNKVGENAPQVPSVSQADLRQTEINENVFNCSDEIRKTMKSVNEMPLLSPCSQERKSV